MTESKISPAFEQYLADGRPNDKRDAIVIYRTPSVGEEPRVRGRWRALKERLDEVQMRAAAHGPIQEKLADSYKRAGAKHLAGDKQLQVAPIASNTLPVVTAQVTKRTLPELAARPEVVAILPNQKIHLIKPKEVNYERLGNAENKDKMTWGLKHLGIPEMWSKAKTKGKGINVAVLDTGVYGDHPALANQLKDFIVMDPVGRRIKSTPAFDCGTHGTHVCGTIAGGKASGGISIGVAPEANLFVAAVLVGDGVTVKTLLDGIAWAIESGADIINMSLGFTYYEPLFVEVFKMLIEEYGVLPVVAIGNENHGNTSSPGNAHNAFSIGAIEKMPKSKVDVPFFSSGASLVFPGSPIALVTKPDVVAPGVQVYSCIPPEQTSDGTFEYSYMDGTSMATPHAAGVAALLMSAKPHAPVTEVIEAMKKTAKHPFGVDARPDNRWGYGMIQPLEAFHAL
ncbi:MAG TPA: S8 family serine peptidase [Pyrinomonadaceae bacterium]|nr:S8 family serine peptidase [Pyrinomonadaceae bacterium]